MQMEVLSKKQRKKKKKNNYVVVVADATGFEEKNASTSKVVTRASEVQAQKKLQIDPEESSKMAIPLDPGEKQAC